jgi:Sap-like sulfolipid-1-addressing protein
MNAAKVVPLAFVMVAGPQILSAIFLATTGNWRRNCTAFVIGAAISISAFVIAAYYLSSGASDQGASDDALDAVVLVLLLAAAVHVYLTRAESEPPKWMGRLQAATPRLSFTLGLLLLGIFPTDILTSVAVGSYLSTHDSPVWHYLPFLVLTLLILAAPAILVLALRERGEALLPKVRDWMSDNSWVVSEVVIVFFLVIVLSSLLG